MTPDTLTALPANVHAELAHRNITLEQVAALLDVHDDDLVVLAGSYATGEANVTSDLDFLVITDQHAGGRPPGSTNHPSIFGDSFDALAGDLVVNIEFVDEARLWDVCRILDGVASAPEQPDLPNLQALELRLVQRLAGGIALTHPERLAELRTHIDLETARASMVALSFVMSMSLLDDARIAEPPGRDFLYRGAGEGFLLSGVNAFGRMTYDLKHLCSRAAALATRPGMPRVVTEWEETARGLSPDGAAQPGPLLDLAEDLYRGFGQTGCPALVKPMLAPFRASWAWSARRFE